MTTRVDASEFFSLKAGDLTTAYAFSRKALRVIDPGTIRMDRNNKPFRYIEVESPTGNGSVGFIIQPKADR